MITKEVSTKHFVATFDKTILSVICFQQLKDIQS